MNRGQEVIQCKKCNSNKVTAIPLALIMFGTVGCLLWIPVIGWILIPIIIIGSLIPTGSRLIKCEECKHHFTVKNKIYKEFKAKIK